MVVTLTGLEPLVVGYFAAWVARKARRVGDRVDGKIDQALDAAVDRLANSVLSRVGGEPAVGQLTEEAGSGVDNERTKMRVQLAIEDAIERDKAFGDELRALVEQIHSQSTDQPAGHRVEIHAKAEGNAYMPVLGIGTQINSPGALGSR